MKNAWAGGGDYQQEIQQSYQQTIEPVQTIESTEVASMAVVKEDLDAWTAVDWCIATSALIGCLIVIASISSKTPFKNQAYRVFMFLARLTGGHK